MPTARSPIVSPLITPRTTASLIGDSTYDDVSSSRPRSAPRCPATAHAHFDKVFEKPLALQGHSRTIAPPAVRSEFDVDSESAAERALDLALRTHAPASLPGVKSMRSRVSVDDEIRHAPSAFS